MIGEAARSWCTEGGGDTSPYRLGFGQGLSACLQHSRNKNDATKLWLRAAHDAGDVQGHAHHGEQGAATVGAASSPKAPQLPFTGHTQPQNPARGNANHCCSWPNVAFRILVTEPSTVLSQLVLLNKVFLPEYRDGSSSLQRAAPDTYLSTNSSHAGVLLPLLPSPPPAY